MPRNRQLASSNQSTPESIMVRSLALGLPSGHQLERHRHPWHQLVYAEAGVMTVETSVGSWVVPDRRAIWMIADFEHSVRTTGSVSMRTLYFRPGSLDLLLPTCSVINVSPLLRELVLETLRRGMLRHDKPEDLRLAGVIVDQISDTPEAPVQIKLPTDVRGTSSGRAK